MKSIRISDTAYDFLKTMADANNRSVVSTLDRFVAIYIEGTRNEELEKASLPSGGEAKTIPNNVGKIKDEGI